MAGACPSMSRLGLRELIAAALSWPCDSEQARRMRAVASSTSKGLGRYSKAPPWKAETALSRSEKPVMMMTGSSGSRALTCSSKARPDSPGIRMSETKTWGVSSWRARITSWLVSNSRQGNWALDKAFSRTHRIEASSSTIHTGFIKTSPWREPALGAHR